MFESVVMPRVRAQSLSLFEPRALRQGALERGEIHGFYQVVIEARRLSALPILWLAVAALKATRVS
jgi:hypothetical protein